MANATYHFPVRWLSSCPICCRLIGAQRIHHWTHLWSPSLHERETIRTLLPAEDVEAQGFDDVPEGGYHGRPGVCGYHPCEERDGRHD